MAGEEVTIIQRCGECGSEKGTYTVKKENMMIICKELTWCPNCKAYTPEVREIAGRSASIQKELKSYPSN